MFIFNALINLHLSPVAVLLFVVFVAPITLFKSVCYCRDVKYIIKIIAGKKL